MAARIPRETIPGAARAARHLALAALIGGNLFGRLAMHPALTDVSDESERGRVLNRAWRRYGTVESLALLTLVSGWIGERRQPSPARRWWQMWRSPEPQHDGRFRDATMGAVVVTGLASAISGVGFAQQAPKGAVPMRSGSTPAAGASKRATSMKKAVNALGALNLASELVLVAVDAVDGRA